MKKIKMTITVQMEVPDDAVVEEEPNDGLISLKFRGTYYMPTMDWMEYLPEKGHWGSVDSEIEDEFLGFITGEETNVEVVSG